MNKKVVSIILLIFVLSTLLININFVSADAVTTPDLPTTIGNAFKFVIGDVEKPGEGISLLFVKFLLMIIIIIFGFLSLNVLDFFDDHKGLSFVLSLIASLLAVRWISADGIIDMILLPYSALGILFSVGLPFVIVFIGIHKGLKNQPGIVRRIAWIFFGLIFLGIWGTRMGGITGIVENLLTGWKDSSYSWYWVYVVTAVLAFIMALMDGTIRGFFAKVQADKLANVNRIRSRAQLQREIEEYHAMFMSNHIDQATYDVLRRDAERKLRKISRK